MNPAVRGTLWAALTIVVSVPLDPGLALRLYAILLGVAIGIYVGPVLAAERREELGLHIAMGAGLVALALAGLWFSPLWLAGAWVLHGVFDVFHEHAGLQTRVPRWYPSTCLTYDVILAAWIVLQWRVAW